MRAGAWALAALLLAACAGGQAVAQASACAKADFEAVVNDAGSALRALNRQNTPVFQAKLRALKDKRNWSNDQFLKEAEPFVRDARIVGYDQQSEQLLVRITGGGEAGASVKAPDCALLAELRAALKVLVETQKAKWAYMLDKIEKELAR
jgi:hypothetical protein